METEEEAALNAEAAADASVTGRQRVAQYDEFGEELGGSSGESDDDAGDYDEDAGSDDEDEVSRQGSRPPSGVAVRLRAARRCRILRSVSI